MSKAFRDVKRLLMMSTLIDELILMVCEVAEDTWEHDDHLLML